LALLVIHSLRPEPGLTRADRRLRLASGVAMLAALPAVSAYVAIGLAAAVLGAIAMEAVTASCAPWSTRAFRSWSVASLIALPLALPGLAAMRGAHGGGLMAHLSAAGTWRNGAVFSSILGDGTISRILDTPAVLVCEFGVVGLLAALEITRLLRRGSALDEAGDAAPTTDIHLHRIHAIGAIGALLLLTTFVRPPLGGPNNLYARPMLVVWGLLAPFAALAFERLRASPHSRRWIAIAALPCVLYVPYAVTGATLEGALFWPAPRELVQTSRWIDASSSRSSLVAIEPAALDSSWGYWLRRRLVLGDRRHALLFGGDGATYDDTARRITASIASIDVSTPCSATVDAHEPPRVLVTSPRDFPVGTSAAIHWLDGESAPSCFRLRHGDSRFDVWLNSTADCAREPGSAAPGAPGSIRDPSRDK
jgi:hypothetical protein